MTPTPQDSAFPDPPSGSADSGTATHPAVPAAPDTAFPARRARGITATPLLPGEGVAAYFAGARTAHSVGADGLSLCGAHPRPGRRWLGDQNAREQNRLAILPPCRSCAILSETARQVAAWDAPSPRPGVIAVVTLGGIRYPVAGCADCERERPLYWRGLCRGCWKRHWKGGTLSEFGYVREDRLADYAGLRAGGLSIAESAIGVGVSKRTAERYERELRETGAAA